MTQACPEILGFDMLGMAGEPGSPDLDLRTGGRSLDVVIAEDDPHDRLIMAMACEDAVVPTRLTIVENGAELMVVLDHRVDEVDLPDLVILDIRMPRMDGHAVLSQMQDDPVLRRVPVAVLSSSSALVDMEQCYARGAIAYEVKPSSFLDYVEVINRFTTLPGPRC